jgi:hypothetical protein
MIYIGHFSFDEMGEADQQRHGYFTCLAEETSAELAADAFKKLIHDLRRRSDEFGHVAAVYIEDIIEIRRIPPKPLCTRIQSSRGEFPESVSRSLPLVDGDEAAAYGMATNLRKIDAAGANEYPEMTPFVTFE